MASVSNKVFGPVSIEQFQEMIEKARNYGTKNYSAYDSVSIIYPNGDVVFNAVSLDDFVINKLGGWANIKAVIAFGSAVEKEVWARSLRGIWPIRWYSRGHVNKPDDFDFFLVLENGSTTMDWDEKFDAQERFYRTGGYGGWWESRLKKGSLDITEGTAEEFEVKRQEGDSLCEHILRMGVLVAGEFLHQLREPEWHLGDRTCTISPPK